MRSVGNVGRVDILPASRTKSEKERKGRDSRRDVRVDPANNRGSLNFHFCTARPTGRINGLDAKRARNKFTATLCDWFDALFVPVQLIRPQLLDSCTSFLFYFLFNFDAREQRRELEAFSLFYGPRESGV